jgi:peptidoglycan hydrolase-like protein with peptidoglycan-binding domain
MAAAEPPATCVVSVAVREGMVAYARCVETRLVELGYLADGPDDRFDPAAVAALRGFQLDAGLPQTGVANASTLDAMGIWRDPGPPTCTVLVPVRPTMVAYARCVETRLRQLGLVSTADDYFDWDAAWALKQFQLGAGLPQTGVADASTLAWLGIWRDPGPPTCTVSATVRPGRTGALCVETRLRQLGLVSTADDYFDSSASWALSQFQLSAGSTQTGIADPKTLAALGIWKPPPNPYPLPANSGTGRRIVYSRAQQRVWAVDASGNVVKTHRVSGRLYEPYSGTYYVYSRSQYTYSATDPSVRWRWMVRFAYGPQGGRIGFHEIPNRNGVPLQTSQQLGLPLSGGCVRQSSSDALWIWNWAPVGTKVVVL